jgi:hypothetical protein
MNLQHVNEQVNVRLQSSSVASVMCPSNSWFPWIDDVESEGKPEEQEEEEEEDEDEEEETKKRKQIATHYSYRMLT